MSPGSLMGPGSSSSQSSSTALLPGLLVYKLHSASGAMQQLQLGPTAQRLHLGTCGSAEEEPSPTASRIPKAPREEAAAAAGGCLPSCSSPSDAHHTTTDSSSSSSGIGTPRGVQSVLQPLQLSSRSPQQHQQRRLPAHSETHRSITTTAAAAPQRQRQVQQHGYGLALKSSSGRHDSTTTTTTSTQNPQQKQQKQLAIRCRPCSPALPSASVHCLRSFKQPAAAAAQQPAATAGGTVSAIQLLQHLQLPSAVTAMLALPQSQSQQRYRERQRVELYALNAILAM